MTTRGQRAILIQAIEETLSDEQIAAMNAAEKREAIAVLQRCIDKLKKR